MRILARWFVGCCLAAIVAGCSGSANASDDVSSPPPEGTGSAAAGDPDPADGDAASIGPWESYSAGSSAGNSLYQSVSDNRRFVDRAQQELIRRCMVRAGFKYWPVPPLPAQYRDPARPLSVADAKARGYRALMRPTEAPGGAETEAYLASLTAAERQRYEKALTGGEDDGTTVDTPAGRVTFKNGGCTGTALAKLVSDPDRYSALEYAVSNLTSTPEFRPQDDPSLNQTTRAWSECMTTSGYHYGSPGEAIEAAGRLDRATMTDHSQPIPDQPTPAARAIAVADATCRASTGWDTANREAVHRALAMTVEAHEADILAFNEMAEQATAKAKQVLGQ